MAASPKSPKSPQQDAPRPRRVAPAPAWQTLATILLILHLFCLGIGVTVNSGGGKSLLGQALRRIPFAREYLRLLWMDFSYDFNFASPLPEDGTHSLELLTAPDAAGGQPKPVAQLPPQDVWLRI